MVLVRVMSEDGMRSWLLEGDPAVRWRVLAQLEDADSEEEIKKRLQGLGYMS